MNRFCFVFFVFLFLRSNGQTIETVAPGIWKVRYGTPEAHLPSQFKEQPLLKALQALPRANVPPYGAKDIRFGKMNGGVLVEMTVDTTERFYGFGLQTNAFEQRYMRREPRISAWTLGNVGYGHAAMPFYISSKGYGVLVNTARHTTFYMASKGKLDERAKRGEGTQNAEKILLNTVDIYGKRYTLSNDVSIYVNGTEGVELYFFAGPQMKEVMQRYNLFSGGGALPPLWGLGFSYRAKATFNEAQVMELAAYFREKNIPCDMLGLEPGWQTRSYSCSFEWNKANFPTPEKFISNINDKGFKLNLWEHAYTHPLSPLFDSIAPHAGNYTVWSGAVPDFVSPEAQRIFGSYHEEQFVKKGVAAFKLDESDAANHELSQREWSIPDIAQFPSGVDGVQMKQLFGHLYNRTMLRLYQKQNQRTLFDVRSSFLFASPYNTALYSDMYSHADFVRMIVNSGFAGVNWSPEVRETNNDADLIRRLQSSLLSAHMVVNGWYLDLPPWLQYNIEKNSHRELLPNAKALEEKARALINLRMSLLPYLYAAFAKYRYEGVPPFRALVMDYPEDKNVWRVQDEYMMGESLLCAPFIDSSSTREVYFPEGDWIHFNTGKKYTGGKTYTITLSLDEVPLFVKNNTILPLAKPVAFVTLQTVFSVSCRVYGKPEAAFPLFEDKHWNNDFENDAYNWVQLRWDGRKGKAERKGTYKGRLYTITDWQQVKEP
jgi:alpha-D-xyloside xylohydrolase